VWWGGRLSSKANIFRVLPVFDYAEYESEID
jgi:hypothetical protein